MNTTSLVSIKEFCVHHNIAHTYIYELNDYGLVSIKENAYLSLNELPKVEKILRLHQEMEINFEGIDVIFNLLDKVTQMEAQIQQLRNRLRIYETE